MNKLRAHGNNSYIVWCRVDDLDTVTVHVELFHHSETEYNRNYDLILQMHLSLSLDVLYTLYTGLRCLSLDLKT